MIKKTIRILLAGMFIFCLLSPTVFAAQTTIGFLADGEDADGVSMVPDMNKLISAKPSNWGNIDSVNWLGDIGYSVQGSASSSVQYSIDKYKTSQLANIPLFLVNGNHEAESASDILTLRAFYSSLPNWNLSQMPNNFSSTTNYAYDVGDVRVIVVNHYTGTTSDAVNTTGRINEGVFAWVKSEIKATTKQHIIVLGHEPTYPVPSRPSGNHIGDSLDADGRNRDMYVNLLASYGNINHFNGHTHVADLYELKDFETAAGDGRNLTTTTDGGIWEYDGGAFGTQANGDGVTVGSDDAWGTVGYYHTNSANWGDYTIYQAQGTGTPDWAATSTESVTIANLDRQVLVNTWEGAGTGTTTNGLFDMKYYVDYTSDVAANPDWSANNSGKWWEPAFNEDTAGWTAGELGVGYRTDANAPYWINKPIDPYGGLATTTPQVYSIMERIDFPATSTDNYTTMTLQLDDDDGVMAWLNGTLIFNNTTSALTAPTTGDSAQYFDKVQTGTANGWAGTTLAPTFTSNDVSAYISALNDGQNTLVIWNVNGGAASSTDLGVAARLSISGPLDNTAPNISAVASSTGSTTATITWTTDDASDSLVEYGLTSSYTASSTFDNTDVTSHSVSLTGLTASTTYHFRVISSNSSNVRANSSDYTFTTTSSGGSGGGSGATTTVYLRHGVNGYSGGSDVHIIQEAPTINNNASTSLLMDSAAPLAKTLIKWDLSQGASGIPSTASVTAAYLVYRVGNTSTMSFDVNRSLRPWVETQATWNVYSTGNSWTNVGSFGTSTDFNSTKLGIVGPHTTTGVATSTLNSAGIQVVQNWINGTDTNYGFVISSATSTDGLQFESNSSATTTARPALVISYVDAAGDTTAPTISNVSISTTTTTATITFTTNESASSTIQYGTTISYGSASSSATTTSHSYIITGLSQSTTYHYKIYARDAAGNIGSSTDATFTTSAADVTPPTISNVSISTTTTTATITFTTNESASSTIQYGTTVAYGSASSSATTTSHSYILTGLSPSTTYNYKILATDAAANASSTSNATFTTAAADTTPPSISSIASSTSGTTATITWTTNEAATSQVEYGLTASYTSSSTLNSTATTSHSIAITGLATSTTYHFRAISIDPSGNRTNSSDATFTTTNGTRATSTFQQGTNGYTGHLDTYIQHSTATTNYGTDVLSKIDGDNPYQATLTKWDLSSIPSTSTIEAVYLSYVITNESQTQYEIYQMNQAWNVSQATWNVYSTGNSWSTSGASTTPDRGTTVLGYMGTGVSLYTGIATTTFNSSGVALFQGWVNGSITNNGLIMQNYTSATNSLQWNSADAATVSLRPTLTVVYSVGSSGGGGGDVTPPVISSIASSTAVATATVSWTTDESSDSKVSYGTVSGTYTTSTSSATMTTSHSLGLTGLSASTRYYYVVVSKDASNNYSTSSENSLLTTAAPDTTAPVISSVASSTGVTTATITFTTDEAASSTVEYGLTTSYGTASTSATTTSHTFNLSGLSGSTLYHFRINARDAAGNLSTTTDATFTTSAAPDTTGPVISSIASSTAVATATVSWTTDESSDSKVSYGTVSGTYTTSTSSASLTTSHSLGLTGLSASTRYYYVVVSKDASNNYSTSSEASLLTTAGGDVTGPVISSVTSSAGMNSAIFTWTTDESSNSKVSYGTVSGAYTTSSSSASLSTSHSITLNSLADNTSYYYVVVSTDASGNTSTSSEQTISTTDQNTSWWNASWSKRLKIDISNGSRNEFLSSYPVPVYLNSSRVTYSNFKAGGADVRFVDADGVTVLDYEIEKWNTLGTSTIWVEVPKVDASSDADFVYMYYGNSGASNAENAAGVWDSNYLMVYHMNNNPLGASPQILDSTSNGRNATSTNITATTTGKAGDSLDFGGINTSVDTASTTIPMILSAGTIEAWFNHDTITGTTSGRYIFSRVKSGTWQGEWRLFGDSSNSDLLTYRLECGATVNNVVSASAPTTGSWYYAAALWDKNGGANNMKLYLNSALEGSASPTCGMEVVGEVNSIGRNNALHNGNLDGKIDEFRVSNVTRSAQWIDMTYDSMNDSVLTFNSVEQGTDSTAPVISDVASSTSVTTATVTWTTDESADSKVSYGTVSGTYTTSTSSASLATSHSIDLSGLTAATQYYYVVVSKDASNNYATSTEYSLLTTTAPDTTAPVISSVASSTDVTTATITWTTDENASSTVEFGATASYGSASTSDTFTSSHSTTLSGLSAETTYHFRINVRDAAGNLATTTDATFTTSAAPDVTPPVISSIASSTDVTSATITWTTDENATSTVEYGLTTGYGSATTSSGFVTDRSLVITGLTASTVYHYRVSSTDASGNTSVSGDYTFTTTTAPDTTAPVISSVATSTEVTTFTITFTTDEAASSTVEYGLTTSYGTASTSATTTSHTFNISGLSAATTYHFRINVRDAAGNIGTSSDYVVTTNVAPDITPPVISAVVSSTTPNSATITWTTNENASSTVEYGSTASYGSASTSATLTTSHSITLTGLTDNTTYHFRVGGADASGNISTSSDATFTTNVAPDIAAPVISSVASSTTDITATITFTTNESASSTIQYGTNISYGSASTSGTTTSHTFNLTGLSQSTTYHFRINVRDAADNLATSTDYTFTTIATPDTTAPVVSSVASSTGVTTATITFTTNESASSTVEYGLTTSYGTASTSATTTSHTFNLSGLSAATTYHFRINVRDAAGNLRTSGDYTMLTAAIPDTTAPTITFIGTSTTQTTATINFTTDEAATSVVQFGTTSGYGSSVSISPATTTHTVTFSGLANGTEYHYKITVTDGSSNVASTSDDVLTTAPDSTAPTISSVSSSAVGTSSATITWTTNEAASSQVELGLSTSYGSSTAVFDTSSRVTSHTVTLQGLKACSSYEYRVGGADALGNTSTSTNNSFLTEGCVGNAEVTSHNTDNITAASGGTLELVEGDKGIALDIPSNFSSVDAVFQIKKVDGGTVIDSIGGVAGKEVAENRIYDLQAYREDTTNVTEFDNPISITLSYTNSDVRGILESSLVIYRYDGSAWTPLTNCVVDTGANTVTCDTSHFSKFGLFGDKSRSSSGGSGKRNSSGGGRSVAVVATAVTSSSVNSIQTTSSYIFTRDLELLSTGDDVKELQKFLNAHGHIVAQSGPGSWGSETTKFGDATKAALARYQAAQGITPASGYFGPKTRALVNGNSVVVTVPATTAVQPVTTTATVTTKRVLQLGDIGDDVKVLQKFLNAHGYTVATSGPGSIGNETTRFGDATKAALIRFQEAYADRILTPQGFTKGTGMYGPASQKVVAEIESKP